MSALAQVQNNGAQYAVKKRRRPQAKKEKDAAQDAKSNPSKRHRDRLNTELDQLAKLIPFPEDVLNKLDKLSILRLAVSYLRNKTYHVAFRNSQLQHDHGQVVLKPAPTEVPPFKETESQLSLAALHGFMLVVTQDYIIFHITETVQDYLGFPQCDVMNQSMLDLIHAEDRDIFMRNMQLNPKDAPPEPPKDGDPPVAPEYSKYGLTAEMFQELSTNGRLHRSFICRLRCLLDNSSGFLALHFTGHLRLVPGQNRRGEGNVLLPPETGLFLLAAPLQTPAILEIRTKNYIFRTKHKLDYTPLGIDAKGRIVLGYTEHQLRQRSGYEFIHSADMMHCADAHTKLMRKGESGLTVFRLLHKNNKWLWVTASARLVLRNGQPDYIISTHRPIPDQEGEDHMKKRSNAFRFDFTGQAVLYGEVNPIGTMGGPDQNPLNESIEEREEEPTAKKIRVEASEHPPAEVDRKTLYGAQSMQRMDIYAGSLPNDATELYQSIEAEEEHINFPGIDPLLAGLDDDLIDSGIHFYPIGTEAKSEFVDDAGFDGFEMEGFPQTAQQVMPHQVNGYGSQCSINANEYSPVAEPPPLSHLPVEPATVASSATYQPQAIGVTSQAIGVTSRLKRSYPYTPHEAVPVSNQNWNGQAGPASVMSGMQLKSQTITKAELAQPQGQPYPQYINNNEFGSSTMTGDLYFAPTGRTPSHQVPGAAQIHPAQNRFDSSARVNNIGLGNNRSVIDSMTINTMVTHVGPNQPMPGDPSQHGMPVLAGRNPAMDNVEMLGHQENMIQFDLNKIASQYQTTDPVSKVECYLSENPSHAMAIATGLMPEREMVSLHPDQVKAYMPSCQYQEHSSNPAAPGYMPQTSRRPISQKDMFYFDQQSDDGSCISPNMSISPYSSSASNMEASPGMPVAHRLQAPNKKFMTK